MRRHAPGDAPLDPRRPGPAAGEARARLSSRDTAGALLPALTEGLGSRLDAGADGFRIRRADAMRPGALAELIASLREGRPGLVFIAQTSGDPADAALRLRGGGFDYLMSTAGHWDGKAPSLAAEYAAFRTVAPLLAELTEDTLRRSGDGAALEQRLLLAAGTAMGFILPCGVLRRASAQSIERAFELAAAAARYRGVMRLYSTSSSAVTALLRADRSDLRFATEALLLLVNRSASDGVTPPEREILRYTGGGFAAVNSGPGERFPFAPLAAFEVRAVVVRPSKPVVRRRTGAAKGALAAAGRPRLVIDSLSPEVDGGLFAVKRIVGDTVTVLVDFFGDDHDRLAAELHWHAVDRPAWNTVRVEALGNDRWRASFPLERLGRHEFRVEGWLDRFGTFCRDFKKKRDAGVLDALDRQQGRLLIEAACRRAGGELRQNLTAFLKRLDEADDPAAGDLLLDPPLARLMDEADERPFALRSAPMPVDAERQAAGFSSWYELFPRSQTDDPERHGTFADVIRRLPAIRAMGFDTLYLPPIHPIGTTHRKGRNNRLEAAAGDPGSPWAIGSEEGGHDAIHPLLGTFDDFRRLVAAAHDEGLEIALDFAIQCSPDHPWLREHPGWFDWRPDGTIKYAENPPKKYEDIVNVDFYRDEAVPDLSADLWIALRDVVLFWVGHGIKTFRVDNPHTKPLPFWQWLIEDVRRAHPEVIFLSEAFTRPKLMYRLAKIGFSQSYTYFIWRTRKQELIDYLTELTATPVKEYFRPHFFVNTPDINPEFLQTGVPAAFRIRAALAATLSGLFGIYSGFELCEGQAVPGTEEYQDSEKYTIKPRDWHSPGNIIADITLLNRLRRAWPALQTHLGVRFYNAWNDHILYYGKPAPGGGETIPETILEMILVAVSLDPHNPQEADFEIPLWEFGLKDGEALDVENLIDGERFRWHGKVQHMRLDPERPYAIWRVAPAGAGL